MSTHLSIHTRNAVLYQTKLEYKFVSGFFHIQDAPIAILFCLLSFSFLLIDDFQILEEISSQRPEQVASWAKAAAYYRELAPVDWCPTTSCCHRLVQQTWSCHETATGGTFCRDHFIA